LAAVLKKAGFRADAPDKILFPVKIDFKDEVQGIEFKFPATAKQIESKAKAVLDDAVKAAAAIEGRTAEVTFNKVGPSVVGYKMMLESILAVCIGIGVAALYCGIRFHMFGFKNNKFLNGLRSGLSLIANALITLVLAYALSMIFAFVSGALLQANFVSALMIAVFASLISAMFTLNNMCRADAEGSNDLVGDSVKKALLPVGITVGVITLGLLAFGIFGSVVTAGFAAACAAGVIAAAYSSMFILPFIWNALKLKLNSSSKPVKAKSTDETE